MANLSIEGIISSGRRSLENKNYWSAFIVALSLPSMCSRVEYSGEEFGNKKGGVWRLDGEKKWWRDKKAYIKWCNDWMSIGNKPNVGKNGCKKDEFLVTILGADYATKLYEMRCNILHELKTDIEHGGNNEDSKNLPIYFSIGMCNTKLKDEYIIGVETICNAIFHYTSSWASSKRHPDLPIRKYYDGRDQDDQELYQKLCDNIATEND